MNKVREGSSGMNQEGSSGINQEGSSGMTVPLVSHKTNP